MPLPKRSRVAAINANCKDCLYDPCEPGTWREQIEACTAYGSGGHSKCALYDFRPRPTTRKTPSGNTEKAVISEPGDEFSEGLGVSIL